MTTTTVDASGPTGLIHSGNEVTPGTPSTYAQAREGTDVINAHTGIGADDAGQARFTFQSAEWFRVDQSFTRFDTSGIPVGDDVTSVTMSKFAFTDNRTGPEFTLEARPKVYGAAVDTGDFVAGSALGALDLLASILVSAIPASNVEFNFTTNGSVFNGNINKTGNTDIVFHSSRQRLNQQPNATTNNFRDIYTHLGGDGTNRLPQLVIIHSAPPTTTLAGTITDDDERDIRAGGSTIELTLADATWAALGAPFNAERQGIINGLDSAQSEPNGWDLEARPAIGVGDVVRSSDTLVTITMPLVTLYDITANETIEATIPASAHSGASAIIATPTFTITFAVQLRRGQIGGLLARKSLG